MHDHNHNHSANFGNAFLFGIILNLIYIAVEFFYGLSINSMALIADAGHNLSDVLGLALAWGASILARRIASGNRTYGFKKSTILASLINAVILLIAVGAIAYESIERFTNPQPVAGSVMMLVAFIGVIINTITALLFISGSKTDLNIKGAFLHMAADAAVSLGVVAAGFFIKITGAVWIDPVISLIIAVVITVGTWSLLRDSFNLSIDAVPANIKINDVRNYLLNLPGITHVHDLHIWAMSTTESALTVHLVKPESKIDDEFTKQVAENLHDKFGIEHTTIQIESGKYCTQCENEKHV